MRAILVCLLLVGCSIEPQFDQALEEIKEGRVSYSGSKNDTETLGRGEYLYRIAGCGSCHNNLDITSVDAAANAIRGSHDGYKWMSESDVLSILAFVGADRESLRNQELKEISPGVRPDVIGAYGPYLYHSVVNCQRCHGETVDDVEDYVEEMNQSQILNFLKNGNDSATSEDCGGVQNYSDSDLSQLAGYIATLD